MILNLRAELSSPGAYVREELQDRGWSIQEFAERADVSVDTVRKLIGTAMPMTPGLAAAVARAFGTDSALWMNLERNFRRWKTMVQRNQGG
jgi:plasmid maintenance system antidote protein VapI